MDIEKLILGTVIRNEPFTVPGFFRVRNDSEECRHDDRLFLEDTTMTAKLFSIFMIGLIFWLAFQDGVLAFFAALCILGLIALFVDAARKEKEEEQILKKKERTV